MPTYAPDIVSVPTAHSYTGDPVTLINQAIMSGRELVADWHEVPCKTGTREDSIHINSAIRAVRRVPQPFANALITLFEGSDVFLPDGFIGHDYILDWIFTSDPLMSLHSGSLPPGLIFTQIDPFEWTITGTPTTLGSYTFELECIVADTVGYIVFHIDILDDPDEGAGFIGGG